MQVKSIHFIPQSPGKPIYKMADGSLRIAFSQPSKNGLDTFWLSEAEIIEAAFKTGRLDKKKPNYEKKLAELRAPFQEARKAIGMMTVPVLDQGAEA